MAGRILAGIVDNFTRRRRNSVNPLTTVTIPKNRTPRNGPRNYDQIDADTYVYNVDYTRARLKKKLEEYKKASEGSKEARLEDFRHIARYWPRYNDEGTRVESIDNLFQHPYPPDKVIKELRRNEKADIVMTALLIAREIKSRKANEIFTRLKAKLSDENFKKIIDISLKNITPEYVNPEAYERQQLGSEEAEARAAAREEAGRLRTYTEVEEEARAAEREAAAREAEAREAEAAEPPPAYYSPLIGIRRSGSRQGGSYKKKRRVRKKTRRLKRRN